MTSPPGKAAAVVLVREEGPEGLQVLLLRRSLTSYFMAGNYIFPGGRLDKEDGAPDIHSFCTGVEPAAAEELPLRIAAIRELFEEAGVLVAVTPSGDPVAMEEPAVRERFRGYRRMREQGALTFRGLAEREGLLFDTARLRLFAHWITPAERPIRFDTRFFLCPFPPGQEAHEDGVETIAQLWTSPKEALLLNMEGKIVLSTPLFTMLEDLAAPRTVKETEGLPAGGEVPAILPIFVREEGETFVVFPWDADYRRYARGDGPHPRLHGSPWSPGQRATRIIVGHERATAYCKT